MMKPTDVLVIGSGLAALTAALSAAKRGKSVRMVTRGAGALAISGGCADLLGYLDGKAVSGDPMDAFPLLPEDHPYRLLGKSAVQEAVDFFVNACAANGLELGNKTGQNLWIPTILGTFKPTWLCPPEMDRETLAKADTVIITRLPWLKDVHAGMVRAVMQKQPRLRGKAFFIHPLKPYQNQTHRNLTALDTARFVDTTKGEAWLLDQLAPLLPRARQERLAVLLPPILGIARATAIRQRLMKSLGCPLVEMLAPPPGVGGLRIRHALLAALAKEDVFIAENTHIVDARVEGNRCISLISEAPDRRREIEAKSFVIATGGFFGGGNRAAPGKACEEIFGIDLGAPPEVADWSVPDIFDPQPYSRLGVRVNARLNAISPDGSTLWENVFFAGRALSGYDFVIEKSGNGVALASGYYAGTQV